MASDGGHEMFPEDLSSIVDEGWRDLLELDGNRKHCTLNVDLWASKRGKRYRAHKKNDGGKAFTLVCTAYNEEDTSLGCNSSIRFCKRKATGNYKIVSKSSNPIHCDSCESRAHASCKTIVDNPALAEALARKSNATLKELADVLVNEGHVGQVSQSTVFRAKRMYLELTSGGPGVPTMDMDDPKFQLGAVEYGPKFQLSDKPDELPKV